MKKIIFFALSIVMLTNIGCSNQNTNSTPSTNQVTKNNQPETTTKIAQNGQTYDPCDLLSQSDVEKQFPGYQIKISQHDTTANPAGQKICFYDISPDDMIFAQLSLTNQNDMSAGMIEVGQDAKTLFANLKSYAELTTPVSGLGSEAYFGGSGLTPGSGLNVLVNDKNVFFTVTIGLGVGNKDDAKHLQIETELAKNIISKL